MDQHLRYPSQRLSRKDSKSQLKLAQTNVRFHFWGQTDLFKLDKNKIMLDRVAGYIDITFGKVVRGASVCHLYMSS